MPLAIPSILVISAAALALLAMIFHPNLAPGSLPAYAAVETAMQQIHTARWTETHTMRYFWQNKIHEDQWKSHYAARLDNSPVVRCENDFLHGKGRKIVRITSVKDVSVTWNNTHKKVLYSIDASSGIGYATMEKPPRLASDVILRRAILSNWHLMAPASRRTGRLAWRCSEVQEGGRHLLRYESGYTVPWPSPANRAPEEAPRIHIVLLADFNTKRIVHSVTEFYTRNSCLTTIGSGYEYDRALSDDLFRNSGAHP